MSVYLGLQPSYPTAYQLEYVSISIASILKNANPDDKLVQLKTLESLEEVAKGPANKVFIPFDATKALASLGSMNEITRHN